MIRSSPFNMTLIFSIPQSCMITTLIDLVFWEPYILELPGFLALAHAKPAQLRSPLWSFLVASFAVSSFKPEYHFHREDRQWAACHVTFVLPLLEDFETNIISFPGRIYSLFFCCCCCHCFVFCSCFFAIKVTESNLVFYIWLALEYFLITKWI